MHTRNQEYFRALQKMQNWCEHAKPGENLVYAKNALACRHVTGDAHAADAAYQLSELGLVHLVQRRNSRNPKCFDYIAVRAGRKA